MVAHTIFVLI